MNMVRGNAKRLGVESRLGVIFVYFLVQNIFRLALFLTHIPLSLNLGVHDIKKQMD